MATRRTLSPGTRVLFSIALIAIAFGVMFVAAEVGLRLLGSGYSFSRVDSDPVLHHVHPPGLSYVLEHPGGEYEGILVAFDGEGRVVDPEHPPHPSPEGEARYRVAFMGDSFVEALQVPFRDSFFGLLQAAAAESTRMANFAVSSYSPILYLLQWRTDVRDFHPTHVFLLLYGNDVRDDETYGSRARYAETGELVAVPGPEITWWRRLARHSYTLQYLRRFQMRWRYRQGGGGTEVGGYVEENPDLTPETRAYLESLRQEIEASGAMLVVMAVPSKQALRNGSLPEGTSEFAEKVEAWAVGSGVEYLDLVGPFRAARTRSSPPLFFEADIHFTEAGNRVVAETIARAFPELFPSPP